MRSVVSALEEAEPGPPNGIALVRDAMGGLLALRAAMARGDVPDPGELRRFRARAATSLNSGRNPGQFAAYRGRVLAHAQRGRLDGYRFACAERSALQFLREDFAEFYKFDDLALADLDEIDEELSDAARDAPPIRDVPSWVPELHWWWRAAKRVDMSEAEARHRLSGGGLDW